MDVGWWRRLLLFIFLRNFRGCTPWNKKQLIRFLGCCMSVSWITFAYFLPLGDIGLKMNIHCESNKLCQRNHGYNFVNSWSICKVFSLLQRATNFQQKSVLTTTSWACCYITLEKLKLFARTHSWRHYRHYNWPVEKASSGVCPCKMVNILNIFCTQTHANNLHFHVFLFKWHLPIVQILLCWCLMVDRPTSLQSPKLAKVSERTTVKYWYFA